MTRCGRTKIRVFLHAKTKGFCHYAIRLLEKKTLKLLLRAYCHNDALYKGCTVILNEKVESIQFLFAIHPNYKKITTYINTSFNVRKSCGQEWRLFKSNGFFQFEQKFFCRLFRDRNKTRSLSTLI